MALSNCALYASYLGPLQQTDMLLGALQFGRAST